MSDSAAIKERLVRLQQKQDQVLAAATAAVPTLEAARQRYGGGRGVLDQASLMALNYLLGALELSRLETELAATQAVEAKPVPRGSLQQFVKAMELAGLTPLIANRPDGTASAVTPWSEVVADSAGRIVGYVDHAGVFVPADLYS